jgi:hypothetical protein
MTPRPPRQQPAAAVGRAVAGRGCGSFEVVHALVRQGMWSRSGGNHNLVQVAREATRVSTATTAAVSRGPKIDAARGARPRGRAGRGGGADFVSISGNALTREQAVAATCGPRCQLGCGATHTDHRSLAYVRRLVWWGLYRRG